MENLLYFKISPEVIQNKIFKVFYSGDSYVDSSTYVDECCEIVTSSVTKSHTGYTYVYSSMTEILSGGTNGSSTLTGLTIPIMITQTAIDFGYYSVFDGAILQKEVINNFLFTSSVNTPNTYKIYNTSDVKYKNYIKDAIYTIDWGDGSPLEQITKNSPDFYSHLYPQNGRYTITMTVTVGLGKNIIKKDIVVPYTDIQITNPKGTTFFVPEGGSWSSSPISYDYIFDGDSGCDEELSTGSNFINIPFIVSGYTKSMVNTLKVYGNKDSLVDGKYKLGQEVTGSTGVVGTYYGESADKTYISYTINGIDYYDFKDGTTVFFTQSSGLTEDVVVCSAITKNETLINVIDEPEIQSNVFIERGKYSAFESIERLNEVNNVGSLTKYGYGFFKVKTQ